MTRAVYTIAQHLRKATFHIFGQFPPIFPYFMVRQRSISGSVPSLDVPWKRNGALLEPKLDPHMQGGVG